MEVFRIALSKFAGELRASGLENRWNYRGQKVIYTAASRSLACLESLVHSSGETLLQRFSVMVIYVPDDLFVESIDTSQLPAGWNVRSRPAKCQKTGSEWVISQRSLLLKVPSAILTNEYNYIINVNHPDFSKIKLIATEPFLFDRRLRI